MNSTIRSMIPPRHGQRNVGLPHHEWRIHESSSRPWVVENFSAAGNPPTGCLDTLPGHTETRTAYLGHIWDGAIAIPIRYRVIPIGILKFLSGIGRIVGAITVIALVGCGDSPSGPLLCDELDAFESSASLFVSGAFLDAGESLGGFGIDPAAAPGAVRVEGFLNPGLVRIEGSCDLRDRDLLDDTLQVMGLKLRPNVSLPTQLGYASEFVSSSSRFDTLAFTVEGIPSVEGLQPAFTPVSWHGIAKLDPDSLTLAPGQDLVLHLGIPDAIAGDSAAELERWTLEVRRDTSSIMLVADGLPPDTLLFPAELFPRTSGNDLIARLTYERFAASFERLGPPPFYLVTIVFQVQLRWTVRIEDPT